MDKVTICTSWDGKDYYSAEYVEKLYAACLRNTSYPFNFVLFAGADVKAGSFGKGITVVHTELSYWWPGMLFWMKRPPRVKTKTKLFIDLDVVIVGNLDTIIEWESDHCYSTDWPPVMAPPGRERDANPGLSLIRDGADSYVWDEYVKAGTPNWNPFEKGRGALPMAAQGILNDGAKDYDLFPYHLCPSYKLYVKEYGLPKDCVAVHFHGRPKQDDFNDSWVKDNWR